MFNKLAESSGLFNTTCSNIKLIQQNEQQASLQNAKRLDHFDGKPINMKASKWSVLRRYHVLTVLHESRKDLLECGLLVIFAGSFTKLQKFPHAACQDTCYASIANQPWRKVTMSVLTVLDAKFVNGSVIAKDAMAKYLAQEMNRPRKVSFTV